MAHRVWHWLRSCRVQLLVLAAGLAALGVFRLVRGHRPWMDWAICRIAMPWKRGLSALLDPIPYSVGELVCAALVIGLLFGALVTLGQCLQGQRVLLRRLVGLAAAGVWAYAGMCLFWGVHYYGTPFSEQAGLEAEPVTVRQLWDTACWFAAGVNRTADTVPRDANGVYCAADAAVFAQFPQVYPPLEAEYPCLAEGPSRRPKKAVFSRLMSVAGFTGYLFPYSGEATLNLDAPAVFLPVTMAHEASHQRGVATEQEANFVGVAASIGSGLPVYEYSGYLFGWMQLTNALHRAAPGLYAAQWNSLPPGAHADLRANSAYWHKLEGPVKQAAQTTYTGFLHSYGQVLGMQSYGACVDLLVARYDPGETEENTRQLLQAMEIAEHN